jgi:hypothetical protein
VSWPTPDCEPSVKGGNISGQHCLAINVPLPANHVNSPLYRDKFPLAWVRMMGLYNNAKIGTAAAQTLSSMGSIPIVRMLNVKKLR